MKKGLWTTVFLVTGASLALGQTYYLRGEFNGWGTSDPLNDMGGGHYMLTMGGLTPGSLYNFKVANGDWSENAPGTDCRTAADAAGNLTVHMFKSYPFADGWNPDGWWRLGYDDPGQFGWEVVGSMSGWGSGGFDLANMGGGLYSGDFAFAAGDYEWKFRKSGDWAVSIGGDFGNGAGNNTLHVNDGDVIRFELDLPNGRWRTTLVPEPASLAGIALGFGILLRRRTR